MLSTLGPCSAPQQSFEEALPLLSCACVISKVPDSTPIANLSRRRGTKPFCSSYCHPADISGQPLHECQAKLVQGVESLEALCYGEGNRMKMPGTIMLKNCCKHYNRPGLSFPLKTKIMYLPVQSTDNRREGGAGRQDPQHSVKTADYLQHGSKLWEEGSE
jgi:hypothetical protein